MSNTYYLIMRNANAGKPHLAPSIYCEECENDFDEMLECILTDRDAVDGEISADVVSVVEVNVATDKSMVLNLSALENAVSERNEFAQADTSHVAELRSCWGM